MLYFIPSWYKDNNWTENEQLWYRRREHTEFDDTVKQIQLFHRNKAHPFEIVLLSFTPNFRHYLHRQGVYHCAYWSVFDSICCIKRKQPAIFSFHNLKWPDGIELVYSQFAVMAYLHGEKYAQIEFAEDGNMMQIDMYSQNVIIRRNIYDDRGFVGSTIIYKDGQPYYQDYLMENGTWKIRVHFGDGHVEVNPSASTYLLMNGGEDREVHFDKQEYAGLDEVISEVFTKFVDLCEPEDIYCVAMHNLHATIIERALRYKKVILSFFEDRYSFDDPVTPRALRMANYIVTDSYENTKAILAEAGCNPDRIDDITPYDSRVDFGISQQLEVQKILVPVDDLQEETFEELIVVLGSYMLGNEYAMVHLFSRKADYGREVRFLEQTRRILAECDLPERWAMKEDPALQENELIDDQEIIEIPQRFFYEQCIDELSVSKCMREQRIIIDMRPVPELYLQIASISAGVPQIVRYKTQYIEDGENGFVVSNTFEVGSKLSYYLDSLSNWNSCLIYCYEMSKKYTTRVLVDKWKEVIATIERD